MELISISPIVTRALRTLKKMCPRYIRGQRPPKSSPERSAEHARLYTLLERAFRPLGKLLVTLGIKELRCNNREGYCNVFVEFADETVWPHSFDVRKPRSAVRRKRR